MPHTKTIGVNITLYYIFHRIIMTFDLWILTSVVYNSRARYRDMEMAAKSNVKAMIQFERQTDSSN